ncbi:MAG: ComEC/Rec2 family competence protein [Candidatus Merdivicinus sp.]|jgi:competence protein ComEC
MNSRPVIQPLALIGGVFAFVLLAASFLSVPALVLLTLFWIGGCLAGALFFLRTSGRNPRLLLLLLTTAAALGIALCGRFSLLRTAGYAGQVVSVSGTLTDFQQGSRASYLLKTEDGDLPAGTKILLYSGTAPAFQAGERVRAEVVLAENPPHRSQLARGADLVGFAAEEDLQLLSAAPLLSRWIAEISRQVRYSFQRHYSDETAGFLTALFFGDRTELSFSLDQAFSVLGLSHILCISGLHIAMLTQLILALCSRIFGRRPISFLLCLLGSGAFVLLTGAGISSIRAWIMSLFSLAAFSLCRDYCPGNSLGAAMLFLCLCNPHAAMGTGFWLSVVSCWGVFSVAPKISGKIREHFRIRNRLLFGILSGCAVTLSANLCCLPFFFLWYGSLPWNAFLPNLLLIPLMPVILTVSWMTLLPIPGCGMLARIFDLLLQGVFQILRGMATVSGSLPLSFGWIPLWIAGAVLLFGLCRLAKAKPHHWTLAVSLSIFLLAAGCGSSFLAQKDLLSVSLIQTDGGGSIAVCRNGRALVIGCGGDSQIGRRTVAFLQSVGVRQFDAVLIPLETKRLAGDVPELARKFPPDKILSDGQSNWAQTLADYTPSEMLPLTEGRYSLWEDGCLILSRKREYPDIGIQIGKTRLLFQSAKLAVPESGWDAVIFYDDFPQKDSIPPVWCAIIETMAAPFSADWLAGNPLFGEYFAADSRYFFAG